MKRTLTAVAVALTLTVTGCSSAPEGWQDEWCDMDGETYTQATSLESLEELDVVLEWDAYYQANCKEEANQ